MKYYAVRVGRIIGIFTSWEECKEQVHKYPKAEYKSFEDLKLATEYLNTVSKEKTKPKSKKKHFKDTYKGSFLSVLRAKKNFY